MEWPDEKIEALEHRCLTRNYSSRDLTSMLNELQFWTYDQRALVILNKTLLRTLIKEGVEMPDLLYVVSVFTIAWACCLVTASLLVMAYSLGMF